MSRASGQRGLTLLELLVAFAIMALALGMLYRAMGGNARSAGDIDRYQQAVVLAESLLSLRDDVPARGWNQAGESAGFQWNITSVPFDTGVEGPAIPRLHEVGISITWSDGLQARSLALTTLRPERAATDSKVRR